MNVFIATQMFYPDIAATSKVMTDLASDISKADYSVLVECQNRAYYNPFEVYPLEDKLDSIIIKRFSVPELNKNSIISRARLSYLVSRSIRKAALHNSSEIYFAVSNPPNMALNVARVANKKNVPFVYILHDLYPDVLVKTGKLKTENSFIAKKLRRMSAETFELSSKVVVLGRDSKDYLVSNYSVPESKIEIITNWGPEIEERNVNSTFKEDNGFENKFIVLYSGNLGETADFDTLIGAAKTLENIDKDILFLIVGNGRKKSYIKEETRGMKNVIVKDFLSEKEYRGLLTGVDCFFVSLKRELYGISVPSKTYYYMSAGKPIVGVLPENSEIALTISENNLGYVCTDYSGQTLAEQILKLKKDKADYCIKTQNVIRTYKEKYTRNVVTDKYISLIKELVR